MAELLIVDDDGDIADLLAEFLRSEGHHVRVARNGVEGLKLVAERPPDLVFLDVEMPILNGPGMAHRMLVRDCGDENIPLLILSGNVDLPEIAAGVGTPYFLSKPYSIESVRRLAVRALDEHTPPRPASYASHGPPR